MIPTNFNEAIKTGFTPYLMESLGKDNLVDTPLAKINAIINDFVKYYEMGLDINSSSLQEKIFNSHNIYLTESHRNYIKRAVERRIRTWNH